MSSHFRSLRDLREPEWPPTPQQREAIRRMMTRVENLYHEPASWTAMDLRYKNVYWPPTDMRHWPLDVWCVYHETISYGHSCETCLVGNLNTASRLDEVEQIYGWPVSVVVSMLTPENMAVTGAPSDWAQYFASHRVLHLQGALDDPVARNSKQKCE